MSSELPRIRVAFGYDSHRINANRPLILGGVRLAEAGGLSGHSDADVICHAAIDALVSAAGLGDIGKVFPESDETYSGADSLVLLRRAAAAAETKGFRVVNCDCTLIAERPKISEFTNTMAHNLAAAMNIRADMVTVKGKTNEGMDSIGRGDGMAAFAVMLIESLR